MVEWVAFNFFVTGSNPVVNSLSTCKDPTSHIKTSCSYEWDM